MASKQQSREPQDRDRHGNQDRAESDRTQPDRGGTGGFFDPDWWRHNEEYGTAEPRYRLIDDEDESFDGYLPDRPADGRRSRNTNISKRDERRPSHDMPRQ